ncbi:MAG: pitrilysin family protein [Pseudomonadota bacterium]
MLSLTLFLIAVALPARAAVEIQEVESPGGFKAWLVEEDSIPFAAIEIRFKGGASLDAEGKRGAVHLMTATLEEGAGDMDAKAFAEMREELATRISFDSGDDSVSVSFRFLTENRDASVALLKAALNEPRFDQAAVDRVREQVLSNIRSDSTDPPSIASEAFAQLAWGDHPYATSDEGTLESVAALTREDIVEAHARAVAKDRVYIAAVGDINAEELAGIMDDLLGDLPAEGAPQPAAAPVLLEPGITVVPFDTPQSVALFGHEGIARDDPDFFPAYIVNEIMGGSGFTSRLMEEVRVKRGLTYGIGSYLATKDHGALVIGQVATVNDRMGETIDVVTNEWRRMATEGLTEGELESAKLYLTGAYPLRFDGNAPIARIMVGMQMDDLPIDYIATRNDNINAVTLDEANRVAQRIYRPEDLTIVVVGQPGELEVSN